MLVYNKEPLSKRVWTQAVDWCLYATQSLQSNELETERWKHANKWMRGLKSTTLLSMPPVPLFDKIFSSLEKQASQAADLTFSASAQSTLPQERSVGQPITPLQSPKSERNMCALMNVSLLASQHHPRTFVFATGTCTSADVANNPWGTGFLSGNILASSKKKKTTAGKRAEHCATFGCARSDCFLSKQKTENENHSYTLAPHRDKTREPRAPQAQTKPTTLALHRQTNSTAAVISTAILPTGSRRTNPSHCENHANTDGATAHRIDTWWWWWWQSKKSVQQSLDAWPYKHERKGHDTAKESLLKLMGLALLARCVLAYCWWQCAVTSNKKARKNESNTNYCWYKFTEFDNPGNPQILCNTKKGVPRKPGRQQEEECGLIASGLYPVVPK